MSFLKTLAKFSVGTWVQAALALVTTPIIAWFITPEEFGKASMFTLAYSLTMNVALLALDQGFARYYNDTENKGSLLRATLTPLFFTCLVCVILIELGKNFISPILFSSTDGENVHLLSVTLITGVLLRISTIAIRMQGSAGKFSLIQVIQAVVNFLCVILYVKFVNTTFEAIMAGLIVSQIVALMVGIAFNYKLWLSLFARLSFDKSLTTQIIFYSLPFVPTFLLDWLFQGLDRTFLRTFSDFTQIGLYATASKIAFSLNVIQTGFTAFWFPYSLNRYKSDPEDTAVYRTVFNALTFTFGMIILLMVLFQDVVLWILPASYSGILPIFPILLFIPMLYTLSEVTVVGVNYKKKTVLHLYIIIFSVIANLIAAYLLIPHYGATGAAISMFAGYIVFFIGRTIYGRRNYPISLDNRKFIISFCIILATVVFTLLSSILLYFAGIAGMIILIIMYKGDLIKLKKL